MRLPLIFVAAAGIVIASPCTAADTTQDALKRFADGVQTFQAHFDQVQTDDHGQVTSRSSGEFWLQRPGSGGGAGKFRWAYEKPYEQLAVCDGDKLWSWDPDLNQVTVRAAKQALAGSPAELLSQKSALSSAFVVRDAGKDGDISLVKLTPKAKDGDFKSIELGLDPSGAPVRMRFADQIGGSSQITFSDIHTNQKIDAAQFRFTPPKDAEIVNGDGPVTKALD